MPFIAPSMCVQPRRGRDSVFHIRGPGDRGAADRDGIDQPDPFRSLEWDRRTSGSTPKLLQGFDSRLGPFTLRRQFPLRYSPSTKLRWGFNSRSSGAPEWTYVSAGRASRPTNAFCQCNKRWWLPCVCCTDVRSGHCLGIGAHVRGISASFSALFSWCVLHCAVAYSGARLPALSR